jgi:cytidylate kinase
MNQPTPAGLKGGLLMNKNVVITIGRQFGSGGRYVGRLLAEKLGVPFYDKELLSEAAKNSGICEEIFEEHDEKPTRSLLFSLVTGMQSHMAAGNFYMDMPLNHKIFLAQFDAIRRIAGEGSCVIVGRCADYVLRENPDAVSIFVKGDMESKIARAVKYYGIEEDKAEERIRKADKQRASYYNYYATATWGDVDNYDLVVDTGVLGVEGAVELIAKFLELREAKK